MLDGYGPEDPACVIRAQVLAGIVNGSLVIKPVHVIATGHVKQVALSSTEAGALMEIAKVDARRVP